MEKFDKVKQIQLLQRDGLRQDDIIKQLNNELKKKRRDESLFESLAAIIDKSPPLTRFVPLTPSYIKTGKTHEAVGMLLSDCHGDQEVLPERVMGYEDYNFEEFCKRAERYVNTTLSFCFNNMSQHVFEDLHIFGLGDYVNGEIHGAQHHSKWENAIKNAMGVGEVFGMMFQDLSKYFKRIFFYSVSGNHGRRTEKKDYLGAHDNWDYLVAKWAVARCKNLIDAKKLIVEIPDSYSHIVEVSQYRFFLNHGDDMKSSLGTPYYALDRTTRNLQSIAAVKQQKFDYFLYGHWHKKAQAQITTGEWIMNGAFRATDEFIFHSMGGYAEPKQKIFGIHPTYGKTWELSVNLKVPGQNKTRYNCTVV